MQSDNKSNARYFESFEDSDIPMNWKTNNDGVLSLSTCHCKDGANSLKWGWKKGASLSCDGLNISAKECPQAGMSGWVYCETPIDGRLTFQLGTKAEISAGNPAYSFRFGLNFTGWRMFMIQFEVNAKTENPGSTIEMLNILPPESAISGCIFLDAIMIAPVMSSHRSADYQIPEHGEDLGGWCDHWPLYYSQQTPSLPLPAEIMENQKRDFEIITKRYLKWLMGEQKYSDSPLLSNAAEQTQAYIRSGWDELQKLNVVKDDEGKIIGPGLKRDPLSGQGFGTHSFKELFYNVLMPLSFDYKLNGNADAGKTVLELFDYIHDQGWAEGSSLGSLWLNPLGFAAYCHAIVMMYDELRDTGRLESAVSAAMWYQTFGKTFTRFDDEYIETNADALRSIAFTSMVMILMMEDTPRKVQYMRGCLDWINNALEISPRFTGLIKPDGLGFHHQGVYAGAYATCAYEFCSLMAWMVHGTEFALASQSIENLKHALITQDTISNKYDVPYTTMGRMPHPGVRIFSAYAYLALAGESPDPELTGIFMRLWDPEHEYLKSVLSVDLDAQGGKFLFMNTPGRLEIMQEFADKGLPAAPPPQGFFSNPWGALAIHRRDDWMLAVKGWSQYVWNFEMHPKSWAMREENVFARYWSYGTLQPITHGNPINPVASGWNLDRGWDWCRWPGATTPHMTYDEIYDPKTSWANRFFSAASFVGGVSSEGRNGMFALKLHEHYYDPTFRAFKTYFFFDDEVICLGSNIETRNNEHTTETTLFQCWMPEEEMPVNINGDKVTEFPYDFQGDAGKSLTIIDPYCNGYFLPNGGSVKLTRGKQQSRDAWNRGETEGLFSTCWLDHGYGPREDGYGEVRYQYVMLMQTTPEKLASYAENQPYHVLQQNHQAHIIEHYGQKTMAYALFETDWNIPHGIIRKTDTPVMAMVKDRDNGIVLSLADPDLRLPKRRNMGYLDDEVNATLSKPSQVRVELRGKWSIKTPCDTVNCSYSGDNTIIIFRCVNGMTVEVGIEKANK